MKLRYSYFDNVRVARLFYTQGRPSIRCSYRREVKAEVFFAAHHLDVAPLFEVLSSRDAKTTRSAVRLSDARGRTRSCGCVTVDLP